MSERKTIKISEEEILRQQIFLNNIRQLNDEFVEQNHQPMKYVINTFGCQMNEHDSENIAGMFDWMNIEQTEDINEADIILFNTCAVRENAELKVFGNLHALKKLKEKNPNLIIAVCGCMMQQPHVVEEIKKKYPHVSLVFGTHNLYKFPELLHMLLSEEKELIFDVWDIDGRIAEGLPNNRKYDIKAFVNIMYGCNNFCTYCIVPYTRGRERSRFPEDILAEVKNLAQNGTKEITLLGQNVNSYGNDFDDNYTFAMLLQNLNEIEGIERIRFMTSHPKDLSKDLIDKIANLEKVCEYIHLPLQSGSSKILKEMNRHYTKEDYLDIIMHIKKKLHNVALSTDIMVGFPGETEEDFQDTLNVVREVEFDSAFTFIYSIRQGTKAEKMEDQVPEHIKKDRFNRLLKLVNEISAQKNKAYLGKNVEVLVEGISKKDNSKYTGRTRENKLVNFTGHQIKKGDFVQVKITEPRSFSLNGEMM